MSTRATLDANTAVAQVAYALNEVCAIYPITPSSPMAELADEWAAAVRPNLWGNVPVVQEMQAEGGAAGTVHGALQSGALTTTFTASQGLMLMLPNMFKIAGELTPTVFHVAARALAAGASSIFGDHQDVMAARTTGFALFNSASVQEAHDAALIAQAASLQSRIPFLHFFDGFRTSHEVNTIDLLDTSVLREMIDDELIRAHRLRSLDPEHPFIRGTWQNPDTYFQTREAVNHYYAAVPGIVQALMERFGALTGRHYRLFEYEGAPDAERIVVAMGSGAETCRETVKALVAAGEKVGMVQVRLYRPFSVEHFLAVLPASARRIAVLDRTKEAGATGEPLYQDVVLTLANACARGERDTMPRIVGGRYGLSSKEFTPAMAKAVFDNLAAADPRNGFTVGIDDDVTHLSLDYDPTFSIESPEVTRAVFFGLGADGTVGANKNSIKIIGEDTPLYAQGYFNYDSHKSGAQTESHLRFGPAPIKAPYLIGQAQFVACHKFEFLQKLDVLDVAMPGGTFLLNAPYPAEHVWQHLPRSVQQAIIDKRLDFHVIDASAAARELGLGQRVNTILQTCFFALSGVLPRDEAIAHIKEAIRKSYGRKGEHIVQQNFAAVDGALARMYPVEVPAAVAADAAERPPLVPADAPDFVREVTARMFAGKGDLIPVSQIPADGTFPSATSAYEKRNVSDVVPEWRSDLCIQCGQCSFVCPHGVIRNRYYAESELAGAPEGFPSMEINTRGFPDTRYTLQIYLEDCTGCGLCIEACPATSPLEPETKALNLVDKLPILERERDNIRFFEHLPVNDRARVDFANVRGVQFLQPLFEFPGACAGCGETPYLRLLSQLFGDRMQVANATGCSSIYGSNLPVTPWAKNHEGRGPAWSNSLFEDNAEFGLGFRLAADQHLALARQRLKQLAPEVDEALSQAILDAEQIDESQIRAQRERVAQLKTRLLAMETPSAEAEELLSVIDHLVRRSVWIIGGDGWAYDIGYGGLDHVLAQGKDVNVLVLDTEVYSNTGGQSSKATPLGAVAKFAAAGKRTPRKDLALQAIAYGNIYVAQVAMGGNPQHTLQAFREAEAYPGPSLILAYSQCIAHGIDMRQGMHQQGLAVDTGYWPLFRFNPALRQVGLNPFSLDSPQPKLPLEAYAYNEVRYTSLARHHAKEAAELLAEAQKQVNEKYWQYVDLANRDGSRFSLDPTQAGAEREPNRDVTA
ncbi:pyruvate:ferredoxin (flavodoxin) oxidoreductase [Salinicola peritrichatus]|uniref:pyruvate:ferredoxin (flavodoxin) oxidoreductase n=1 Tax=Salinicola peritrichatus TaxID=1267424 RepID=UPI000DA1755D|nr:pyruvate:ferredoxin (flavodoxin) oxidoreductase [Salinicola peritrichatus]